VTKAWSHLPNAKHIDWVIKTVEEDAREWSAANAVVDAARVVAWEAAWNFGSCDERKTAGSAARSAVVGAVRRFLARFSWCEIDAKDAAFDAIDALVAWDSSGYLLDKSVKEVTKLAKAGNHAAVLLLPAVIVKNKLKGMK
jgi:hypothetical protein